MSKTYKIALIPGDGTGPEVIAEGVKVINAVAAQTQNVVFAPIKDLKTQIGNADVIEIGCGLGQNSLSKKIFNDFIKYTPQERPIIVDADGLNLISQDPQKFIKKGFKNVIFTPHPKEAARLLYVDNVLENTEEAAKPTKIGRSRIILPIFC